MWLVNVNSSVLIPVTANPTSISLRPPNLSKMRPIIG